MDLLSELVSHLRPRCQPPLVHTFEGSWGFVLPPGRPSIHLLRHGAGLLWTAGARHSRPLGEASVLLYSGATACTVQARGARLDSTAPLDWDRGRSLRKAPPPPEVPGAVQLVSARIDLAHRPIVAPSHPLPLVAIVEAERVPLARSYRPLLDSLLEEISFLRVGADVIIRGLLDVLVVQVLRNEVVNGFGVTQGWLGAMTDPVLRTCLDEQEELPTRDPARSLASASTRSARRLGARVKAATGSGPRRIAQERWIQRVLHLLESGVHPLARVAEESGFSTVSAFCRAFRRETGMSPGTYWRRVQRRRLPRSSSTHPG